MPGYASVPGEFVMEGRSVTLPEAAMQFFVESMRANTKVLESVQHTLEGVQNEQREQLKMVTEVRERMIRLEAVPSLAAEVGELREKVHGLEMAKAQEDARASTWARILQYGPSLAGIIVTVIASVLIVLVASGQLRVTSAAIPPEPLPTDQR